MTTTAPAATPAPAAGPPPAPPDAGAGAPVIRVEDLHRVYDMGETRVHALRGVSLAVERGGFVAVMGASGSGKSTLMNILGCLDRSTAGRYLLDGTDVAGLDKRALAGGRSRRCGTGSSASSSRGSTCSRARPRWRTCSSRVSTRP